MNLKVHSYIFFTMRLAVNHSIYAVGFFLLFFFFFFGGGGIILLFYFFFLFSCTSACIYLHEYMSLIYMNTYKNNLFENKYTHDQYKGQGRVLPTRSLVLVKFVYQYTYIIIHIHTHIRMYIHTYTYMRTYTYTHMRAAYMYCLFICLFFLFSSFPLRLSSNSSCVEIPFIFDLYAIHFGHMSGHMSGNIFSHMASSSSLCKL